MPEGSENKIVFKSFSDNILNARSGFVVLLLIFVAGAFLEIRIEWKFGTAIAALVVASILFYWARDDLMEIDLETRRIRLRRFWVGGFSQTILDASFAEGDSAGVSRKQSSDGPDHCTIFVKLKTGKHYRIPILDSSMALAELDRFRSATGLPRVDSRLNSWPFSPDQ